MIQLICESTADANRFAQLIERWGLTHVPDALLALVMTKDHVTLRRLDEPKTKDIIVDFTSDELVYRCHFGGGRNEAIAKAVGIKSNVLPTVIDATAGLGRDAFILTSLGCQVTLFERHPVVCALLEDGLMRAYADPIIGKWVQKRMSFIPTSSFSGFQALSTKPDVVYLDPMFPRSKKRALVKKEMQYFQLLIGCDDDADVLLPIACQLAQKRVVVKRPSYAPFLGEKKPEFEIKAKNHRFDIYLNH